MASDSTTTIEGELLARDVFPAEVLLPAGQVVRVARVFVTTHRVIVWSQHADKHLSIIANLSLAEENSVERSMNQLHPGGRIEVKTVDGPMFVNRALGCGCGSPLKALQAPVSWSGR